ncbi:MAG TPA: NrsF family protein [Magnetovibrio sp.]
MSGPDNKRTKNLTDDLIADLAGDLTPVKRLDHPAKRLAKWLALALPVSLLLGAVVEQQHLTLALARIQDPRIVMELGAIFLTALSAGYAALCSTQPGRLSKAWALPIVPFALWLSLVGENCWRLFEQIGPDQFSFAPHWTCFPSVAATGFAPALVMVVLLKRGAWLTPSATVALGTLAASALGAVGLRLYHPPDATALLMLWQLIATVTFLSLAGLVSSLRNRWS